MFNFKFLKFGLVLLVAMFAVGGFAAPAFAEDDTNAELDESEYWNTTDRLTELFSSEDYVSEERGEGEGESLFGKLSEREEPRLAESERENLYTRPVTQTPTVAQTPVALAAEVHEVQPKHPFSQAEVKSVTPPQKTVTTAALHKIRPVQKAE
jgi:hypothetical protein